VLGRYLITIILVVLAAAPARAQLVQPDFWGTDGEVTSIARLGNTIYLAGLFSSVGPATGGAVPIDRRSGVPWSRFARVNGIVHAVTSDGSGGWFVGGDFTAVEGEPHHNVAHLRADGTVDSWDPHVEDVEYVITSGIVNPIHTVSALALGGDVLYIGGRFEVVGGQSHRGIAAVNASTGAVLAWNPQADGAVTALVADREMLFVGGGFSTMAGQPRARLAAFRLADGSLTAWNPAADGTVLTMAVARNMVLIGGEFDHVGGEPRNSLAAVTLDSGAVAPWDAGLLPKRQYIAHGDWVWPYVSSIVIHGHTLFAGGGFDSAGGAARYSLAELDLGTGRATPFDAHIGAGATKALAMQGQTLYVGGYLYDFGGVGRPNLAALDARTGIATAWNPRADGITLALAVDGNTVLAAGQFTSLEDWQPRKGLAALDATTGRALPWEPTLDAPYYVTLVAGRDRVYASGNFTSVDGLPRGHFAAFDGVSGALTDWNPWTRGITAIEAQEVRMVVIGDTVFVASSVDSINGIPRHRMFALEGRTGALLSWAPNPRGRFKSGRVGAMSALGSTLFVAGEFDSVGGAWRPWVAQLDGTTGHATPWTPDPGVLGSIRSFYAHAILSNDEAAFVGVWQYDLSDHWGLLAFDRSGSLLDWVPALQSEYHALIGGSQPVANAFALHDNMLFVGGRFDTIGTEPRANLGAIDAATGAVLPWDPDTRGGFANPFDLVSALTLTDDILYVGGRFWRLGGYPSRCFAALALTPSSARLLASDAPERRSGMSLTLAPNPSRGAVRFAFSLVAPATVSLDVFDISGRRVATPLNHSLQPSGDHALSLDTTRLRAGIYYCRLHAGADRLTRRFVVLD
jgi:hypothetical protein